MELTKEVLDLAAQRVLDNHENLAKIAKLLLDAEASREMLNGIKAKDEETLTTDSFATGILFAMSWGVMIGEKLYGGNEQDSN